LLEVLAMLMGGRIKVFSIAGIPIYVHTSWLLIYALITWTLAVGYFPRALPDVPTLGHWVSGLVAALLLFLSVLVHELAHSLVATRRGLTVRGITLHVFGGVSHLEDEAPDPRSEFLIAIVGPLASFAIAAVLWAALSAGVVPDGAPRAIVVYLLTVNVVIGVFNLVPGFPLDGGRLLRAALWRWTGTLARATAIASRVGRAFAVALMTLGVVQIVYGQLVGGVWMILLGLFLRSAADASYAEIALREALGQVPVQSVMARDVVSVPAAATVDQLVRHFWSHHFTSFPVVDGRDVVGLVTVHQVPQVPEEARKELRVDGLMTPLGEAFVVRPQDSVLQALGKATRNGVGRLAVLDADRRLVGYLSLKDIVHVLALRGITDGAGAVKTVPEPPRAHRAA
jgi:Zn-dependent protease/predicted transcriptional regulator